MWKKIGLVLLLVIIGLAVWYRELIDYGIMQGRGQFEVLWNARSVEEVMQDPAVPDSLKQRLQLVAQVRDWGVDSLALSETKNYTTLYDQKGKDILWVVTATRPYSLENKEWRFPVVGTVSYKGYFNYERAQAEEAILKQEGWDTHLRSVGAWSTLGWFRDPILSNMLFRLEGDLINTVLHELTHATVFVPDSLSFNENLATFIGHRGTLSFIEDKWGTESEQMQAYVQRYEDRHIFSEHVLRGLGRLDSLYKGFSAQMSLQEKEVQKQALIEQIVDQTSELPLHQAEAWEELFRSQYPNNAYFMSYERYKGSQEALEIQFRDRFEGNLKKFLEYYRSRYGK